MSRRPRLIAHAEAKKKEIEYTELIQPIEMTVADNTTLVFSVSQRNEDESPRLDIRTHIKSERYTGPTKKGINFDIENIEEFRGILASIDEQLEKLGK